MSTDKSLSPWHYDQIGFIKTFKIVPMLIKLLCKSGWENDIDQVKKRCFPASNVRIQAVKSESLKANVRIQVVKSEILKANVRIQVVTSRL